ncbi:MAG: YrdB family protein [Gaiellaceae bacterium]
MELAALVAYGVWGDHAGGIAVALILPLVVAVLWGIALSPRARVRLPVRPKFALRLGVLLLSGAALAAAGHVAWGTALGAAVLADNALPAARGR